MVCKKVEGRVVDQQVRKFDEGPNSQIYANLAEIKRRKTNKCRRNDMVK
jgi:hypothetical protein